MTDEVFYICPNCGYDVRDSFPRVSMNTYLINDDVNLGVVAFECPKCDYITKRYFKCSYVKQEVWHPFISGTDVTYFGGDK